MYDVGIYGALDKPLSFHKIDKIPVDAKILIQLRMKGIGQLVVVTDTDNVVIDRKSVV